MAENLSAAMRGLAKRMAAVGAVKTGGQFRLASGVVSDTYFDVKRVLLDPEGVRVAARFVAHSLMADWPDVTAVGGPELGAVPLVGAVLSEWGGLMADGADIPLSGFIVRKQPKNHGTGKLIEGELQSGALPQRVALVEDVTTTAGSVLKAIDAVEAAGAQVAVVYVVVNRGGDEARRVIEERGAAFVPLLDAADVLAVARGETPAG